MCAPCNQTNHRFVPKDHIYVYNNDLRVIYFPVHDTKDGFCMPLDPKVNYNFPPFNQLSKEGSFYCLKVTLVAPNYFTHATLLLANKKEYKTVTQTNRLAKEILQLVEDSSVESKYTLMPDVKPAKV